MAYLLQHKYLPLQQEGKVNSWKIYFQDEARFGLMTVQRRVLIGKGVQPIGAFQHRFIYRYVYGIVSPMDGDHFYITGPRRRLLMQTHMMFNWFLEQFSAHKPEELKIIFLDRAGYHLAKDLKVPDNILLWHLPPYCPELNGIERFWQEVKRHIAWHNFQTAQELEQWLDQELKAYSNEIIASITGYPYIINSIDDALSYALS